MLDIFPDVSRVDGEADLNLKWRRCCMRLYSARKESDIAVVDIERSGDWNFPDLWPHHNRPATSDVEK